MIGRLARLGVMGWLANQAYRKYQESQQTAKVAGSTAPRTAGLDRVAKHMEVVGADGGHVGIVDGVAIKLTRTDPAAGGVHHLIPWDPAATVRDGKLVLTVSTAEALQRSKTVAG